MTITKDDLMAAARVSAEKCGDYHDHGMDIARASSEAMGVDGEGLADMGMAVALQDGPALTVLLSENLSTVHQAIVDEDVGAAFVALQKVVQEILSSRASVFVVGILTGIEAARAEALQNGPPMPG